PAMRGQARAGDRPRARLRDARVQGVDLARDPGPARVDRAAREDRLMRPRRLPREEEATLVEHLEELRGRIMVGLAAVAVATAVAFAFHDHILEWLSHPLPPAHRHLAAFSVTEPFSVSLAVSL